MYKNNEIMITGASGMVGKELQNFFPGAFLVTHKQFDLTNQTDVNRLFNCVKGIKCIIHLAARVGGILDNMAYPAEYFDDNVLMNTLMVKYAHRCGIERFIGVLSSCIFPNELPEDKYPLKLENLFEGPPAPTNFSYGFAKRCLAVQIDAYNKQYGTEYNYVMPCNLYGPNDKFDHGRSHFVPALIKKIIEAEDAGKTSITLMGDGTPLRQFMHARDFAYVLKYMIDNGIYENLNVANDENLSIIEMARIALKGTGNDHWDITFSGEEKGQHRKDICNMRLKQCIPGLKFTKLEDGVKEIYELLRSK
jgi:GDP-L-fucose synthase